VREFAGTRSVDNVGFRVGPVSASRAGVNDRNPQGGIRHTRTIVSAVAGAHDGLIPCGCRCSQTAEYLRPAPRPPSLSGSAWPDVLFFQEAARGTPVLAIVACRSGTSGRLSRRTFGDRSRVRLDDRAARTSGFRRAIIEDAGGSLVPGDFGSGDPLDEWEGGGDDGEGGDEPGDDEDVVVESGWLQ